PKERPAPHPFYILTIRINCLLPLSRPVTLRRSFSSQFVKPLKVAEGLVKNLHLVKSTAVNSMARARYKQMVRKNKMNNESVTKIPAHDAMTTVIASPGLNFG
uniref:Uncharacterized protein n=1 Tax=Romanomermis culicivorax TaxID=13658 RepID=A0A915HH53_ROMCU